MDGSRLLRASRRLPSVRRLALLARPDRLIRPQRSEPRRCEPRRCEPQRSEPLHAESLHPEPLHPEPLHAEPPHAEPPHAEPPRPAPRPALVRDPVLLALAALILAAGPAYGTALGPLPVRVLLCWLVLAGLHGTLAIIAGRIARAPGSPGSTRRIWAAVRFAALAYALGDLIQLGLFALQVPFGHPITLQLAVGGTAQTLCVLVGTVGLVAIMLTAPVGFASRPERIRYWLDVSIVMLAATAFGGYGFVPAGSRLLEILLGLLIGPGVFLVGVFAVVKLVLSADPPFSRAAGLTMSAAATVEALAEASSGLTVQQGRLSWQLGITLIASTLLLASGRIQYLQARRAPEEPPVRRRRRFSALPYAAVASTYLLLVVALALSGLNEHVWVVVCGAIASTALVVWRQLMAFTENARLLDELDVTVQELHRALGERDELAAQLRHQAFHDPLTGLANRMLFRDRLMAADAAGRAEAGRLTLALVDLDDFKPINDEFGHAAGDELLIAVARRLSGCVRETDLVARLGGDEFGLLIEGEVEPDGIAGRILAAMAEPFTIAVTTASLSASVGVVVSHAGGTGVDELLGAADTAMYAAKRAGKGAYQICSHPARARAEPGPDLQLSGG